MTRDQVLDEVLAALHAAQWSVSQPYNIVRALKSRPPGKSLEVDPPLLPDAVAWPPGAAPLPVPREVTTDIDRLVDERDALRKEVANERGWTAALAADGRKMSAQLDGVATALGISKRKDGLGRNDNTPLAEMTAAVVAERDALKARLEAQERRAEHWETQAGQYKRDVERLEWEARGAPMRGEPSTPAASPFDGHPFVPMPGMQAVCATCGYADNPLDQAKGIAAHPPRSA